MIGESKKKTVNKQKLISFFMGKKYPLAIAALTLIGNLFLLDFYTAVIILVFASVSLLVCSSVKPLISPLILFVCQISLSHAPSHPTYSTYFFEGMRLPVLILCIVALFVSLLLFMRKTRFLHQLIHSPSPVLPSLLILSSSFICSGAFSGGWELGNLIFAFLQVFVFLFIYLLFYHGFSNQESFSELCAYLSYVSLLTVFVIVAEMTALFLSGGVFDGFSINKESVVLGWGIWNLIAVSLSVHIPLLFLGARVNKYPFLYYSAAVLAYVFSVLTMSRNALVFATLIFFASLAVRAFTVGCKKRFLIAVSAALFLSLLLLFVFWSQVKLLLADIFERGLSDNGRFSLWRCALVSFCLYPLFGAGFYGTEFEIELIGPLPAMAHNTFLQLLSSVGLFGFFSYLFYRIKTALPFFRNPSFPKTMLGLSVLNLLLASLLDNFIFSIYPVFLYNISLALVGREDRSH